MILLKTLDKRRWTLPNGKSKTATFGLFKCSICGIEQEKTLTQGNASHTCGDRECTTILRKQNQEQTFILADTNPKKSPYYRTFQRLYDGMKQRCYNQKNNRFEHYGGRGITVCDNWLTFDNFVRDMFKEYEALKNESMSLKASPSIDRIDKNKSYCKDNCEWIRFGENSAKDKRIPIHRMDFNGTIIDSFDSATQASEKLVYTQFGSKRVPIRINQILACCIGTINEHAGYKWIYATDKTTLA